MAATLRSIASLYQSVIIENIDERSKDWIVVSPFFFVSVVGLYLLFVKKCGPSFMAGRNAFKIEPIIIAYNIFQIIACSFIFLQGGRMWIKLEYNWYCQPVDRTVNEDNDYMANLVFIYFMIKISDLLDTVFFILRKKNSHVTFLHVYHHSGMIVLGYLSSIFSLNGHFIMLGIVNSFVHVTMYTYYLVTAWFPDKKPSIKIKKCLTILQLVQFIVLLIHNILPMVQPNCKVQRLWSFCLAVQFLFMTALFSDFYVKAYLTPKEKKSS